MKIILSCFPDFPEKAQIREVECKGLELGKGRTYYLSIMEELWEKKFQKNVEIKKER